MSRMKKFFIRLRLGRDQRKLLDEFLALVDQAVQWTVMEHRHGVLSGLPSSPEILIKRLRDERGLDLETAEDVCNAGITRASRILAGEISGVRGTHRGRMVSVPVHGLVFAVYERTVRVPHVGLCQFVHNAKILHSLETWQLSRVPHRVEIGYRNNDPTVCVDTVDRTVSSKVPEGQRLVKITRGR